MSNSLIATWQSYSAINTSYCVLPDGCRDLIIKINQKERPLWFISPLFNEAQSIMVESNATMIGLRIKPGAEIQEQALLDFAQTRYADEIEDYLDDFVRMDRSVDDALKCLASNISSIKQASTLLGVSARTLQRFILKKTKQSPSYWYQLARVRKAAKHISYSSCLATLAQEYGFSDQSHMTREFQRWFKCTPVTLLNHPDLLAQLSENSYG